MNTTNRSFLNKQIGLDAIEVGIRDLHAYLSIVDGRDNVSIDFNWGTWDSPLNEEQFSQREAKHAEYKINLIRSYLDKIETAIEESRKDNAKRKNKNT